MKETIYSYFLDEKTEAFFILLFGIFMLVSSFILFKRELSFYKYMAVPFFIFCLIQLVVGSTVYFRTDSQISTLVNQFTENPQNFKLIELNRMHIVMNAFKIYKVMELSFITISLVMLFFSIPAKIEWMSGLFLGICIQSLSFLIIDFFAEPRGALYLEKINQLTF